MTCLVRTWRSGWSYCACSYFSRLSTQPDYWSRRIRSASSSCDGHQDEDRKNSPVVEKEAVPHEIQKLLTSIQEGDRASLAKAITLGDQKLSPSYLAMLLPNFKDVFVLSSGVKATCQVQTGSMASLTASCTERQEEGTSGQTTFLYCQSGLIWTPWGR